MKIIPIIRLSIVSYMVYRLAVTTITKWSMWGTIETVVNILLDFLTIGFVIYSIIESLDELKNTINDNIRFLRIYGLIFQIVVLVGGTLVIVTWEYHVSWRVIPAVLFLVGYLILVIVDLKKIRRQT